jgi:biotin carboxyl carrier protein
MTVRRVRVAWWRFDVVRVVLGLLVAARFSAACRGSSKDPRPERSEHRDSAARIAVRGPEVGAVRLDAATAQRIGIATRTVGAERRASTVQLLGELVSDPGHTTLVRAAVTGRLAAADGHWPALGELVAYGAVLGQVSDAMPLVAPHAGTVTRVEAQPGQVVQAGQELLELSDFSTMLARIVWRADLAVAAPRTLALSPMVNGATATVRAVLVGPASTVDSLTRSPVYLYRMPKPWHGARPGAPVVASVIDPTTARSGVLVPADAVVQWDGLAWAYVARERGEFTRVRVETDRRVEGGFLVEPEITPGAGSGVRAGDAVVVRGAQFLLSEEFRSRRAPIEEEPD